MPISSIREVFKVEEIKPKKKTGAVEPNLYDVDLAFNGHDSQYSLTRLASICGGDKSAVGQEV